MQDKQIGVSGLGPAGLIAVQMARAYGAAEVVAIDPIAARRRIGIELGRTGGADAGRVVSPCPRPD